jgi:isoquinoline 1-oxidoreductase beta subunit
MSGIQANRRDVVRAVLAGGGLALAFGRFRANAAQATDSPPPAMLSGCIHISPDDSVVLYVPRSEMGQGVHTGLAMLVAEDLRPDWSRLSVRTADLTAAYGLQHDDMRTAGSDAITSQFDGLRRAGAAARHMLRLAAARRWNAPLDDIEAEDGWVRRLSNGQRASYGELAAEAAGFAPPQTIVLRAPADWTVIGTRPHRLDAPAKIDGSAAFGLDVRLPGMLVGAVRHCPRFGGRLTSVDPAPALAVKGVTQVVSLADGVIVLGDGYWSAAKGAAALAPEWNVPDHPAMDDASITAALEAALPAGQPGPRVGDVDGALRDAAGVIAGAYDAPYAHHWLMEPMNATAQVTARGVEVWSSCQGQTNARTDVAKALGIDPAQVRVHTPYVGGSFGRRMQPDVVVQAALASQAAGRPVQVIWSREEDTRHGLYRPRARATFQAGIDAAGRPLALKTAMAENCALQAYARRNMPTLFTDLAKLLSSGMIGEAYEIPNAAFDHADLQLPPPVGPWHSVQYGLNGFFAESMIDELAHLAGRDPLAYRRERVSDPRHKALLDKVAALSGWGRALPPGHGLGVALVDSFGSPCAQVVEVEVKADRRLRLVKVWCAVDCGLAVYPLGVETQMITGALSGLSMALFGEINIADGAVVQGNFDGEPLLRHGQAPDVEVAVLQAGGKMGGAGESGLPPAAPALTNALFAASGERVRSLPLRTAGWRLV